MLRSVRKFIGTQRVIPWIGEFKETLAQAAFWFSLANFIMIAATFYFTTLRYIAPWLELWMFITFGIISIAVILVIEYKFITPSIWAFRGEQMELKDKRKNKGK